MFELKDLEFKFKYNDEVHTLRELTIGDLEQMEADIKKESKDGTFNESGFYKRMIIKVGLPEKVASSLSIRQIKELAEKLNEAKKK